MSASGDITRAPDTTSPGPSLLRTIGVYIVAFIICTLAWTAMLILGTWLVRYCAVVISWAWQVGR